MPGSGDPAERFWGKVDPGGPVPPGRPDLGPWRLWAGSIERDGYGRFNTGMPVGDLHWLTGRATCHEQIEQEV